MATFTPELISIDDVEAGELNIYNPDADEVLAPTFVVRVRDADDTSRFTDFKCRRVETSRVFMEIPIELALLIQNASDKPLEPDSPIDYEAIELSRAMHEYNAASVRLGLIEPALSEEQISQLPTLVVRDLSEAITDTVPEPVSEEEDEAEKSE